MMNLVGCQELPQNLSLLHCPPSKNGETTICCFQDCCFLMRQKIQFWKTWYFWLAIVITGLLFLFWSITYITNHCRKKQHSLIRVRHQSARLANSEQTTDTSTGPEGLIQPKIEYNKNNDKSSHNNLPFLDNIKKEEKVTTDRIQIIDRSLASPLSPAYNPIKPVTIIRGSAPPLGFRQTSTYTELVLPPGYINSSNTYK